MGSGETGGMNGLGGWTGWMDWAVLLLIITGECYYSFFLDRLLLFNMKNTCMD